MTLLINGLLVIPLLLGGIPSSLSSSVQEYLAEREALLGKEVFLGSNLSLNDAESAANATLMTYKLRELYLAFVHPSIYSPAKSFLTSRKRVQDSAVFKFIQDLPKGAALHTHDLSLTSASWVVANITYESHLYVSGFPHIPRFKWRKDPPGSSNWTLLFRLRDTHTPEVVDNWLLHHLDITVKDPARVYPNVDRVWEAFMGVMEVTQDLLSYAPIYDKYLYEGLSQFERDGVSYIEIRTVFPDNICQDLTCSRTLSTLEVASLNKKTIDRFLSDHPQFCGVGLIYAPVRDVSKRTVHMKYLKTLQRLRHYLPGLVRGFDLVGQEDKGKPLIRFIGTLLEMKRLDPDLQFLFHAGETNWEGTSTDQNLFDAVLLNATRIGHGYALLKHPVLKALVKSKGIAVEICPISNQVLGLLRDLRNHPGSLLMAEADFPTVISSDDPGSWGAQGLSYDLYEAFMGLAGRHMDLRLLKKLIWNSIEYSLLKPAEKDRCRSKLEVEWNKVLRIKQTRREIQI